MKQKERISKKLPKRIQNRMAAFVMAAVLGISNFPAVHASALSDAQNTKDQAQSALDSQKGKINEIQQQKDSLMSEINALDADLVNIITNINILEGELEDKQAQLEKVSAELIQAQEDEKSQYGNMKKRIRYMYENGETNTLAIILGAVDFADFLNRIEYASQVYDYDRNLLTAYQETKEQVAQLKLQVEGERAELQEIQSSYEEQQQELEVQIANKRNKVSNFDNQMADAKELAKQYQNIIAQQNSIIQEEQRKKEEERKKQEEEEKKKIAAANNNNNNGNSNTGGKSGNKSDIKTGDSGANPGYSTKVSGGDVVNYACQFIGNPYVLGGESLTDGADCSGFIMSVYAKFGITLPHSSAALQSCGKEVSYNNAKAGDLICYAGHVAIYMGGGQIVHASNSAPYPAGGIKTNSATYRPMITVRRVL